MSTKKPKLIFLMGPTASGKSALAFSLAEVIPVEIISVDSTQVYRGLDIGSAKPTPGEQATIPHHLIDIRDPAETYSAAEFRHDALAAIEDIVSRNKIPLLVGGTMLYFNVLLKGMADLPEADPKVRAVIEQQAEELGWPAMHQQLADVDPITAARLHPNHSRRIARALEIYRITGQTMSELHQQQEAIGLPSFEQDYGVCQLALSSMPREVLHQRIADRFEQMITAGFEEEVSQLRQQGKLNASLPALRAVGYRQMWSYLDGEYDKAEMIEKGKAATRQLAKRQLTWLRSWNQLERLKTEDNEGLPLNINQIRDQALNCFASDSI